MNLESQNQLTQRKTTLKNVSTNTCNHYNNYMAKNKIDNQLPSQFEEIPSIISTMHMFMIKIS